MIDDFGQSLINLLPNLRRFALSLCRSRDVADDLVQQTCQKALANRERFDPDTRLDAWLFRILRNSWIDQTRRYKTEGTKVDIDDAHDLSGPQGSMATEHRLMLGQTFAEIERLPDDQREVLVLVCVEELSYKETADVLDVPIGTVMSRLARARKKLSERLGINDAPDRSAGNERTKP